MKATRVLRLGPVAVACSVAALASCKDPTPFSVTPRVAPAETSTGITAGEDCSISAEWFPITPPVRMFVPTPHPDTECPFYRGAYQNFLVATQPDSQGQPALLHYATLDDAFVSATPHAQRNTSGRAWLGTVRQAGYRNVLVDQDGHTLYYGLHMNQAFVSFIRANNLQTVNGILAVDPHLSFPPGLVEFKTAWKDIDPGDFPGGKVPPPGGYPGDPGDYSNYITTTAWVSHLSTDPQTGIIVEDFDHPRQIRVALVAIHAVYTLPGHPEFVWGSIQHVNLGAVDPTASAEQGINVLGVPDDQPDPSATPRHRPRRRRPGRSGQPSRLDGPEPDGVPPLQGRDPGEPGEPAVHERRARLRREHAVLPRTAGVDLPHVPGVQVPAGGARSERSSRSTPT